MPTHALRKLNDGEILVQYEGGGGGYGDRIERDPALVLKDVKLGYLSIEVARDMYGVVIDPDDLKVDEKKTKGLRQEIINERLRVGKKDL